MLYEISEEAKKEILNYCDNYEIFIEKSKTLELDSQKSNLNFAKEEVNFGVGIRVIKDNKLGFAFTSDINQISKTAKQAYLNTKLNESDKNFGFSQKEKEIKVKKTFDSKVQDLSVDDGIDFLKSMLNTVEEEKCEVTSGGFSSTFKESLIINSNDVSIYDKGTGVGAGIAVNAYSGEELSTAYDSESSRFFDLNGEELVQNVCKIAKDSLGGEVIETGDKTVVLDYHASAGLLSTFIASFSADNVQRGRSILKDKIGENIVSSNLSITNDSTLEKGLMSGKCDGEGVNSKKTVLVSEGKLKSFIYDIYTSNKDNVKSTSNGYRSSYSTTPQVSPSNLIFDFSKEIDISEIKNGFISTDVLGAHTANPISGDFSVEANNSFLIENGEITKPVKKAMISGNIFNILKDCNKLKSENKQQGPFIIPKILINSLRVVGQ
ncbi:TldD/PmbA family protein [Methanobrevibacter sp. OttesenSCG-928-K11]|nr:TldD/PmbA family protein [Methanobrevibacter sp. OttesenSCG-928-K11]